MSFHFPPAPKGNKPLSSVHPSAEMLKFLAQRRSPSKNHLGAPGPAPEEVDELLRIAARVPDHRRVEPWRFIVFEGDARHQFGRKISAIYDKAHPECEASDILEEAGRLERAPVVVAVISSPDTSHKTPVWEQELSCGAVCYNLLLAASSAGWGAIWLSEWIAFNNQVDQLLGLAEEERIAGYIYLGKPEMDCPERPRPNMEKKITRWNG